jgi:hypothetical protein
MHQRAFHILGALIVLGTALELATERHWKADNQYFAWIFLGLVASAVVLGSFPPSPLALGATRMLSGVTIAGSLFGIFEHIKANYDAIPLDYRYTKKWTTMSTVSKVWTAVTKSAGPSPVLAPGILALAATCMLLAVSHGDGAPVHTVD